MNDHQTAVGYLRAFVTVLVLAFHSVIAYAAYAPAPAAAFGAEPYVWAALPVVDPRRWKGFDLFIAFNDVFFMALMFFLSGLFVWPSLVRKGSRAYLRDRGLRLGVPFVLIGMILMPLAYYPSYRMTGADPGAAAFLRQWLSLDHWPAGPCWFIAILFVFDCLAVALRTAWTRRGEPGSGTPGRPFAFFCALAALSAFAYLPMCAAFGEQFWLTAGPFAVQASRVLLYACYFFAGIAAGAQGIEHSFIGRQGRLARQWRGWLLAALLLFAFFLLADAKTGAVHALSTLPMRGRQAVRGIGFVLSCAASGFFLLALFMRFGGRRYRVLDHLRDNAYGMYLIHYVFACWLQYALIEAELPAIAKGGIVFAGTLGLSWAATGAIRRIPVADRLLCRTRTGIPAVKPFTSL